MPQYSFPTNNFLPRLDDEVVFPLEEVIEAAAAAGFPAIGLHVDMVDRYLARGHSLDDLRAVLDQCEVVCTDLIGLVIDDDENATLALTEKLLHLAEMSGAGICAASVDTALGDDLVALAIRCANMLDPADVRITFEFTPVRPIDSITKTRALCEQIGWDRVGVTLDSWHFFRGPDTWDTLRELQPNEITLVQFDDALPAVSDDFFAETRLRRVMPGDGEFDLDAFTTAVRNIGFDGIVSPEILSPALRALGPAEFARQAMASTARFWN